MSEKANSKNTHAAIRFKSCANCRALVHNRDGGFYCYMGKQYTNTQDEVYDRRLDAYVKQKPVMNCKVLTLKSMVQSINIRNLERIIYPRP
jgi:hypothetical protein